MVGEGRIWELHVEQKYCTSVHSGYLVSLLVYDEDAMRHHGPAITSGQIRTGYPSLSPCPLFLQEPHL